MSARSGEMTTVSFCRTSPASWKTSAPSPLSGYEGWLCLGVVLFRDLPFRCLPLLAFLWFAALGTSTGTYRTGRRETRCIQASSACPVLFGFPWLLAAVDFSLEAPVLLGIAGISAIFWLRRHCDLGLRAKSSVSYALMSITTV